MKLYISGDYQKGVETKPFLNWINLTGNSREELCTFLTYPNHRL